MASGNSGHLTRGLRRTLLSELPHPSKELLTPKSARKGIPAGLCPGRPAARFTLAFPDRLFVLDVYRRLLEKIRRTQAKKKSQRRAHFSAARTRRLRRHCLTLSQGPPQKRRAPCAFSAPPNTKSDTRSSRTNRCLNQAKSDVLVRHKSPHPPKKPASNPPHCTHLQKY